MGADGGSAHRGGCSRLKSLRTCAPAKSGRGPRSRFGERRWPDDRSRHDAPLGRGPPSVPSPSCSRWGPTLGVRARKPCEPRPAGIPLKPAEQDAAGNLLAFEVREVADLLTSRGTRPSTLNRSSTRSSAMTAPPTRASRAAAAAASRSPGATAAVRTGPRAGCRARCASSPIARTVRWRWRWSRSARPAARRASAHRAAASSQRGRGLSGMGAPCSDRAEPLSGSPPRPIRTTATPRYRYHGCRKDS